MTIIFSSNTDVHALISSRKWARLKLHILKDKPPEKKKCTENDGECQTIDNLLHVTCKNDPPLHIVKFLRKQYPQAVFEQDENNHYPLHVACKNGCSPEVIKYLLKKNCDAATKVDHKRRTPFLLAIKCYVHNSEKDWIPANQDLYEVASILSGFDSMSYFERDNEGNTALSLAVDGMLSPAMITLVKSLRGFEC